jgi:hypothetical protein
MNNPATTYKLSTRLAGTAQQYFTLVVKREGQEPQVHTSKAIGYLYAQIPAGAIAE